MKRKQIGKKQRFEIFKRDSFTCQYCGNTPPDAILEVDHIVSIKNCGTNDYHNLITSCRDCNRGKAANSLNNIPKSLKDCAKEIKEKEEQLKGYYKVIQKKKKRIEADTWIVINVFLEAFEKNTREIEKDKYKSIKTFIEKIGLVETQDAMELAICRFSYKNAIWKYFCGICWNKIRKSEGMQ